MKADWLHQFHQDLATLQIDGLLIESIDVRYRSREKWFSGKDEIIPSAYLDKALASNTYSKIGKQRKYAFPLQEVGIVVEVALNVFAKRAKLNAFHEEIEKTRENSQHKFDALHDALTGGSVNQTV